MTLAALAFAAGAALLQLAPALPPLAWALCVPVLLLAGLRYRAVLLAAALAAYVGLRRCRISSSPASSF